MSFTNSPNRTPFSRALLFLGFPRITVGSPLLHRSHLVTQRSHHHSTERDGQAEP